MTRKKDFDVTNPPMDDADLAKMKPLKEALPDLADKLKRGPGRPPSDNPKQHIGMRLDADIVEWLRSRKGYNALVNETLRREMEDRQ